MGIFFILIFVLSLYKIRFVGNADPFARSTTDNIKGVFIVIVFMRHVVPYLPIKTDGPLNYLYGVINWWLLQLLVAMFLFYSGYGVMCGVMKKQRTYIKDIPKHRCLNTLINFDIAVLVYLLLGKFLGNDYSSEQIILALCSWESLGNSNWYIFIILLCYCLTYLSMLFVKSIMGGSFLLFILCCVSIFILSFVKPLYWCDTILCFPLGTIAALHKEKIIALLDKCGWSLMILSIISCTLLRYVSYDTYCLIPNIRAWLFVLFILCVTRKFIVGNTILLWLGKNLFPIYIYQRFAMILFANIFNQTTHPFYSYIYVIVSFALTLLFAWFYHKIEIKL